MDIQIEKGRGVVCLVVAHFLFHNFFWRDDKKNLKKNQSFCGGMQVFGDKANLSSRKHRAQPPPLHTTTTTSSPCFIPPLTDALIGRK